MIDRILNELHELESYTYRFQDVRPYWVAQEAQRIVRKIAAENAYCIKYAERHSSNEENVQ